MPSNQPREDRDSVRSRTFRFRISPREDRRFRVLAAERGVDRAELIREVLGLNLVEGAPPPPAAVPADRPDPKTEPGAAAMVEVAERIQRKKGRKNG
jgi:hypothetical protein